jgi:hypothetical protein
MAGKLTQKAENVHFDFGPAHSHNATKPRSIGSDLR